MGFWVLGWVILCYFWLRAGCEGKEKDGDGKEVHQAEMMFDKFITELY
jgi:hypothetical protein